MTLKNTLAGAVLAAAALPGLCAPVPAIRSSASIGNFGYQLIDLTPADGIAPSIVFEPRSYFAEVLLQSDASGGGTPVSQATTHVFGTVDIRNANGRASATLGPNYSGEVSVGIDSLGARGGTRDEVNFVLSPNARVIFSADGSVDVAPITPQANGFAIAELSGEISSPFTSHRTTFGSSVLSYYGSEDRGLSVVANSGDDEAAGFLVVHTGVSAVTSLAPIPEPGGAAMMLAGLGLLGAAGARRWKGPGAGAGRLTAPARS